MPSLQNVSSTGFFGKQERIVPVRPGLDLILGDFRLTDPGSFHFRTSGRTCELAFVLSGTITNRFPETDPKIVVPPRHVGIWISPAQEGCHECLPDEDIRFACLSIQKSLLRGMIKTELPGHPFSARIHADQQENAPLHRISPMSVAMQTAVQQIFLCDYHGRAGSIFMESKALELLSHILADLRCDGSCHRNNPAQARRASQQIRLARQTLMDAIVSPPSLSELAEHVGMSVTSLTRKFRNAYGVSVFELLRNERLEKARMLLEDGEMNVTEVAYAVGFSSPAHLTRLFFSRFKIHPGEFRRRFLSSR